MMAFLLLFIVFAITYNNGMARSVTESDIKTITQNRINSEEDTHHGDIFNFPTVLKPQSRITIKGRLKHMDNLFKVVLRGNEETNENTIITYNFESETMTITSTNPAKEPKSEKYILHGQKGETFSLRIKARSNKIIVVDFEVNQLERSSAVYWDIGDLRSIKYMEMQQGVERTDTLLFELK